MTSRLLAAVDLLASGPAAAPWVIDAAAQLGSLRPALVDAAEVAAMVRPYRWLLERVGADGLVLTSAGYLRPDDIRALMMELGWTERWIGAMNRENQTLPARQLRLSATALRLVRRHKGRLVATTLGRSVGGDPMLLWRHIARSLPLDRRDADVIASSARLLWAASAGPAARAESDERVAEAVGSLFALRDGSLPTPQTMWLLGRSTDDVVRVLARQDLVPSPTLMRTLAVTAFREALHPERPSASASASRSASASASTSASSSAGSSSASTSSSTRRRVGASSPRAAAKPSPDDVACLTVKVTLRGVTPPVWRRVRVPVSMPLADVALVLVAAMGWTGAHLWAFRKGRVAWMIPEPDWSNRDRDARTESIGSVLRSVGDRAHFEYDFGDGWDHDLVVESAGPATPDPVLLEGRRNCPPEDVGGPWGYGEFLKAISDPDHPEHFERLEWAGGAFDAAAFDLDEHKEAVRTALANGPLFGDW